jgi:hypothetical protein
MIYAMYTRENFECWDSWFGSFLNMAFILFSPMPYNKQGKFKEMIVMRLMMKTNAMTLMMAGPRTVV